MEAMELDTDAHLAGHSVSEYFALLRRRRAIILQAFVLVGVLGIAQSLMTKNVYESSAKLLVEGPSYNMNTVDSNNPLAALFQLNQQQTVDTQVEVLQAQPLLDQVEKQVGPASLSVSNLKETNVIEVTAESSDPKIAAAAPNTLLHLYITQDNDNSLGEMERARQFVIKQGNLAHQKLTATENALKQFKQQNHLAVLTRNRDDQIALVTQLTGSQQKLQIDMAALRAQITSAQRELDRTPATIHTQTHGTNTVIAGLQEEIRKLEVQRLGLVQPGGWTSEAPQVRALDAQIAGLKERLESEPPLATSVSIGPNAFHQSLGEKIADLEAQIPVLETQRALNNAALAQAASQVGDYAGLELIMDRLTRRHDTAQEDDKNFSEQLNDLNLREKAHHATARLIESAQVPAEPIRPKRIQSIVFACLIGLFVGLCLALMQEFLDDRINSVEDAARVLGLPSLGYVPALSPSDAHLLPQMTGPSPASESYRVLRTNILFATVDAPARTLLVTSAASGEGKTTTAANLAFAMAMDGRRVILVDTDLRRPSLHHLLELPPVPGLTDVLLGRAPLLPQEVMPGLSVLTAGSTPPNPGELLGSRKFRSLVEDLTAQADLVIFDSPPILVAADAAILASQMDGTILVVETGVTKKAAAKHTLQLLKHARAVVLGVAYNKLRAQEGLGYCDYSYQYGLGTSSGPALISTAPEETSR